MLRMDVGADVELFVDLLIFVVGQLVFPIFAGVEVSQFLSHFFFHGTIFLDELSSLPWQSFLSNELWDQPKKKKRISWPRDSKFWSLHDPLQKDAPNRSKKDWPP
jgi:hypothetical protein